MTIGAAGLVAAYIIIGLLLLSINLYSKWSWPVKVATIVVTSVFYLVTYFSIPPLLGWPTTQLLPERFRLLAVHIQEPNKTLNLDGEIYLWISEVGARANNKPRAFRLPYDEEMHAKAVEASTKLRKGLPQLGEIVEEDEAMRGAAPKDLLEGGQKSMKVDFYDLPDPLFPEK